ncbi:MAG: dTDP-4-dehydrorhamnose 3,5-epimerase [Candidatus Gygaella obscura]|nr:dTDP-4-dehydrorhamnose 3,5-epimerase [Candidatus Gygaella obscura]
MAYEFKKLEIPGVVLIDPKVFRDKRGFFLETYKRSEFVTNGIDKDFVQYNHSKSKKGTLRGLHYQLNPNAQAKIVRVIRGRVFDVAVDVRKNSLTYGKWVGRVLSAENKKMLYIPEGFAHGFCVLSFVAEVIYSCTKEYDPGSEAGVVWNDPDISIDWPIKEPIISNKDFALPLLNEAKNNFN